MGEVPLEGGGVGPYIRAGAGIGAALVGALAVPEVLVEGVALSRGGAAGEIPVVILVLWGLLHQI